MEKNIIERICAGHTVRRIGCNGRSVTMPVISRFIVAQMRMLVDKHFPIVILFDREKRQETSEDLAVELGLILTKNGFAGQFVIGIPDRSTENWFLSDWPNLAAQFEYTTAKIDTADGYFGKDTVRKLLPGAIMYNEPVIGAKLFCAADPQRMYSKSPSFRRFVNQMPRDCRWLSGIRRT